MALTGGEKGWSKPAHSEQHDNVTSNPIKVILVKIGGIESDPSFGRKHPAISFPFYCLEGNLKTAKMPVDLNGYWKMISNDNFEEYLKALGECCLCFYLHF